MTATFAIAAGPGCEEVRFAAMGCAVHVMVVGGSPGLTTMAQWRISDLESLWSRFLPASDVSRANAAAGRPTPVAALTITLFARAVEGWKMTGGRFDPTVLPALEAMGYDRSFEQVGPSIHPPEPSGPAPGCRDIVIDAAGSTVTLPVGVRFDPGGIGKGLAADLLAQVLVDEGAAGVCVNLGGDMRIVGEAPTADGWIVGLEDPYDQQRELARTVIADARNAGNAGDAGVATTSRTYRTWERAGAQVHHLIDPATGAPAWTDLASVTVVADCAWRAEVLAKAAFLAGPLGGAALVAASGASGVLVDDGGFAQPLPGSTWEVAAPWSR